MDRNDLDRLALLYDHLCDEQLHIGKTIAASWFRGVQVENAIVNKPRRVGFVEGTLYCALHALQNKNSGEKLQVVEKCLDDLLGTTDENIVETMNDIVYKLNKHNILF